MQHVILPRWLLHLTPARSQSHCHNIVVISYSTRQRTNHLLLIVRISTVGCTGTHHLDRCHYHYAISLERRSDQTAHSHCLHIKDFTSQPSSPYKVDVTVRCSRAVALTAPPIGYRFLLLALALALTLPVHTTPFDLIARIATDPAD